MTERDQPISIPLLRKPDAAPAAAFEPVDPPASGPLVDTFGRAADDLRVSVTDRCNFRCTYCMPAEGLNWLPKDQILTFEETERLMRVFVSLGVGSLKITGGSRPYGPTFRPWWAS